MHRGRGRLSYANVMATLAVFVALGGSAYAVSQLPKNSVRAKQIAKDAVKDPEIADNAVDSSEVEQGSLLSADFAAGQLPVAEQGPRGIQGEQGVQGPPGPTLGFGEVGALAPNALETSGVAPGAGVINLNTPTAGRLFVTTDALGVIVNCETPNVAPVVGLYVDGQPLGGTRRNLVDSVAKDVHASGFTGALSAGTHKVEIGADCPGASTPIFIGGNDAERSLDAIFLGG